MSIRHVTIDDLGKINRWIKPNVNPGQKKEADDAKGNPKLFGMFSIYFGHNLLFYLADTKKEVSGTYNWQMKQLMRQYAPNGQ